MDAVTRPVGEEREDVRDKRTCLPAFEDDKLSAEAQEQLAQLLNDESRTTHKGRDLPRVAKEDLLAQLR